MLKLKIDHMLNLMSITNFCRNVTSVVSYVTIYRHCNCLANYWCLNELKMHKIHHIHWLFLHHLCLWDSYFLLSIPAILLLEQALEGGIQDGSRRLVGRNRNFLDLVRCRCHILSRGRLCFSRIFLIWTWRWIVRGRRRGRHILSALGTGVLGCRWCQFWSCREWR